MYVTAAAALLGFCLYVFSKHDKLQEAGRLLYFAGILVTLFRVAGKTLTLPW